MKILKELAKPLILIPFGGVIYILIENIWRNHSHWSMFWVGGICFFLIGLINEVLPWDLGFIWQGIIAALIVTFVELLAGLVLNVHFSLGVWDYSKLPFNFHGQISLLYSLLWVPLSAVAIFIDDWLRHNLFDEVKPKYKLL